jgi:hypothetical protein
VNFTSFNVEYPAHTVARSSTGIERVARDRAQRPRVTRLADEAMIGYRNV